MPSFSRLTALVLLATFILAAGGFAAGAWAAGPVAENLAVVLLIDTSGSMRRTDPENLRETAANMLIDLLSPEDRFSVITFNHDTEVVIPLQAAAGASRRAPLKDRVGAALREPEGDTDLQAALQAAAGQLEAADAATLRPVVVLLTDGEPNPGGAYREDPALMEAYMAALWETVAGFTLSNRPVYTVAFSEEVDPEVIEKISLLTKGDHYLLATPRELLVSFYKLLETLKNRQEIVAAAFTPQSPARACRFRVDPGALQVNVLIESPEEDSLSVSLRPPPGAQTAPGNPLTFTGRGYSLIVFDEPGEELQGEWEVTVAGRGPCRILGNADNRIKIWFVEPRGEALHPLGEPLPVRIRLTGLEQGAEPLQVTMSVTGPDLVRREQVPLAGDGGEFSAVFSGVDRPGRYELLVTALRAGEAVATAASSVQVKNLPLLASNFQLKEHYRTGESLELEASLLLGGHRAAGGSDLTVEHFDFVLAYDDGSRIVVVLHDDGDPAHGDLRAGDGLWSNRLVFDREGEAEASLLAVGRYHGETFLLEKNLGRSVVRHPGEIAVHMEQVDLYAAPGRTLAVPLTVENRSPFEELLLIRRQGDGSCRLLASELLLAPGETRRFDLGVLIDPACETGPCALQLSLAAAGPLTAVKPPALSLTVQILSPAGFLRRRLVESGVPALALKILLAGGGLFFCGGLLLYGLLVRPRQNLGRLFYWAESPRDGRFPAAGQIRLSRARKKKVTVSFDSGAAADFVISGGAAGHDLVFTVEPLDRRPAFLLGWQALLSRRLPVKKMVACTPPGKLEAAGDICTARELAHGDEFRAAGFVFRYLETFGRGPGSKEDGINLLEGKM